MKYILILVVTLLIGCGYNELTDNNVLSDSNFSVSAKILEVYKSKRLFILWEFNGSCYCYISTSRFSDLSGDVTIVNAKCPSIINPIKTIQLSEVP